MRRRDAMSKTFHVRRSEQTNMRSFETPEEWRKRKRFARKLQKTYIREIGLATEILEDAVETRNGARQRQFEKRLKRTRTKLERLDEDMNRLKK